ncbi:MAG: UDP-N-acetyl-D-glucosamine dehydrogenase [Parcubacteria group bacterium Gr01-1014_38]|nr:MAG: UDP-N-acetyl-D-glucosamine dehydrogenase [Parcubacteria group bacterium Gr01-1014_38]
MNAAGKKHVAVREPSTRVAAETVAIVGLGYVGIPVAAAAREKGFTVLGYDVDQGKVARIATGVFPFRDAEVETAFRAFPLEATSDARRLADADTVIVAVPTPVDHDSRPDFSPLRTAVETVALHAKPGVLLSIESTVNPGVCEEMLVPLLRSRGRDPDGGNVLLVHCPERVNPGDTRWTIRTIPRVLGGYTDEAAERGLSFYTRLLDASVKRMSSLRAAEAVKMVENAFRDVNIAFVNELAQSFDRLKIDVAEVLDGASTKPFAFLAHFPGCGVGGHCIPVDPHYLIEHALARGFEHRFLKLAREINQAMPRYTVEKLQAVLAASGVQKNGEGVHGVRVALLGLAYKRDVNDLRESPALEVEKILRAEGAVVTAFDPYVPERSSVATLDEALQQAEAIVLATDHTVFRQLMPDDLAGTPVRVIVDGRNCLDHEAFRKARYAITGIGR